VTKRKTTKQEPAVQDEPLIAYKGFDADWKCRGYQFEVGKTYTHDGGVKLCKSGFHACEYPLDVFRYYPLADAKVALVELRGVSDEKSEDSKRVGKSITIKAALSMDEMIKASVEWALKHADGKNVASGDYSTAASSGYGSTAASSGDGSAAASSGDGSTAASSGYGSKAASSGKQTIAMVAGYDGRAKAGADGCIALAWHDGKRPRVVVGYVGEGIDADTFYRVEEGELVKE
jgi:hypothetical protein